MPDVDWEKVAADVADLPDDPTLFVEWWAFADHLDELIAAIRWGLEAQQRGERVVVYGPTPTPEPFPATRTIERAFDGPPTHLLVPLEGS